MSKVTILNSRASPLELPLVTTKIQAGFPPPEEYLGDSLDLNDYVIKNPSTSFLARIEGDSMIGASILQDDILAVDRS